MNDLFTAARAAAPAQGPLADRMRPRTLDEFIGQRHIVGPGKLLAPGHRGRPADQQSIFWGPPGCGKTTLASIIARETTRSAFVQAQRRDQRRGRRAGGAAPAAKDAPA